MTYKIKRSFFNIKYNHVIKTGVTLEKAQEHCNDPETSYKTCTTPEGIERTKKYGMWFDVYTEE